MTSYCYAIVCTDGESVWTRVVGYSYEEDAATDWEAGSILGQLMKEGWVPVRETPMSGSSLGYAFTMVLLEYTEPDSTESTGTGTHA
jgi:hypothetical protein